jgi:hypothetical protein
MVRLVDEKCILSQLLETPLCLKSFGMEESIYMISFEKCEYDNSFPFLGLSKG